MKSTNILAVFMTLLFSVFSVSARPQDTISSPPGGPSDTVTDSILVTGTDVSTTTLESTDTTIPTSLPNTSVTDTSIVASFPITATNATSITTSTSITLPTPSTTPNTTKVTTSSTPTANSTSTTSSATLAPSSAALPMAMRADGIAAAIIAGIVAVIAL